MGRYKFALYLQVFFIAVIISCDADFDTLRIVSCIPGSNVTGVSPESSIEIAFSEDVNRTDVEDNLSLTNSDGSVSGVFSWISQAAFRFTPSAPISRNGRYVIVLPRSIRDTKGNTMESDFISEFYVGTDFTPPRVLSSVPAFSSGAVTGIAVNQDIIINFSKSMNREVVEREFGITPDVPGYFVWSEGTPGLLNSTVTYTLTGEMEYGKRYTVKVSSAAEDSAGNSLGTEYVVNFITGDDFTPPSVNNMYDWLVPGSPWDTASPVHNISKGVSIGVTFSKAMDRQSVEKAFSVTPTVQGVFEWSSDTIVRFVPSKPLDPETKYQVAVEATAKDRNQLKLSSGYSVEIVTDNPDSLYVKCGTLSGSNHDGDFTVLPDSWPRIIDMGSGTPVNQNYYILIEFLSDVSPLTQAEMERYSIFDNVIVDTFKGTSGGELPPSAYIGSIEWIGSSTAKIKVSGMTNKSSGQVPALYRLKIAGGENGIKDIRGNYMENDLVIEFREAIP